MRYIPQLDITDCGAACLAMIASHYGKQLSIAKVRSHAGTDIVGTNINGLVLAAGEYGLKATPVKGNMEALQPGLPVPFITHMHIEDSDGDWREHFVVVARITKKHVIFWDPDPTKKKQKVTREQFAKWWTGYTVFFAPDSSFQKTEKKENLLLKFIPVFIPHRRILAYAFLSSCILLAFGLLSSFYYKYLFDEVIYAKASLTLNTLSLGMFCIVLVQNLVEFFRNVLLAHFSYKTDLQLNFSYLSHIFKLPVSFFESRKSGEILSRLGDLGKVKSTLSTAAISGIMDILMLLVSGPVLFRISSELFFVSLTTVVIIAVISILFAMVYRSYYGKVMSQEAEVQSFLYESINGVATVKAMNAEDMVHNEFEKKRMKATGTSWHLNKFGMSQGLITGLISGASSILIYWIGSRNIIDGVMSFGTLITFNALLSYFTGPLLRLVNIQNTLQESLVAAERVGEILELEWEQARDDSLIKPDVIRGDIQFEDVTFAYGARNPVLDHFSLHLDPGQWTAFVGASGSGKTTLTKLILKFYEVQKGRILLDGIDLRDMDINSLRNCIGYVPQDIFLFSGTVAENIALHHPDTPLEEIIEAAKKAGAHEFIENLPKRYNTILGEHGGGLSGGEKQRLALARAMLGNPQLIILDEATSSLDTISEMEIHEVLRKLRDEKVSVILIAHRLSTVMNCDQIFVMKSGTVVEQGNHQELLSQNGYYRKLWDGSIG